jgi:hypothetical protein
MCIILVSNKHLSLTLNTHKGEVFQALEILVKKATGLAGFGRPRIGPG